MPNEFKVRNGLVVDSGGAIVTGSITARQTGVNASGIFTGDTIGSIALTTDASNGFSLFTFGGALQIYDNVNAATRLTISASGSLSVNAITSSGIVSIGRSTTSQAVIQRAQAPAGAYSFILASGTGIVDTFPYTMADGHGATVEMRAGDPTSDQYGGGILITANGNTSPLGDGNAIIFKNRTGVSTYTERMRITYDGNVGVGTNIPTERFHVSAAGIGTDVALFISGKDTKGGTGYLDFLKVENTAGGVPTPKKFFRINNSDGAWEVVNDAYSQTIMKLEDNGNMQIAGTLTESSDESLKTNIQTIPNALEKTLQLRGVEYDRISTNKHEIGLIAQEVEQIFPELVSEANGIKSVAYSKVVSILIESIKELKQEVDTLREQINNKL